jgi:hypothetical protein
MMHMIGRGKMGEQGFGILIELGMLLIVRSEEENWVVVRTLLWWWRKGERM